MTRYIFFLLYCWLLMCVNIAAQTGGEDVLSKKIDLSKQKGTVYQLLRQVSDRTGYQFIYDSQIVDNDKKTKLDQGEYILSDVIHKITDNSKLKFRVVGSHILLYVDTNIKPTITKKSIDEESENKTFILTGKLIDQITNDPIIYGTVSVVNSSIGTISNMDGEFKLILPDSLLNSNIRLSHLGYQNQEISASLLAGQTATFMLEPEIIPLQEIVVRLINPIQVLQLMKNNFELNYSKSPVYLTSFYREGIESKKNNINLTEAVFKVYKSGYQNNAYSDQVKLLKMRKLIQASESDSIITKMKSGIFSTLMLDLIKNQPDFFNTEDNTPYQFAHTDITTIDGKTVNVISFEQNEYIQEPLYRGELYIDTENYALLQAKFEINPEFIKKATDMFVEKQNSQVKFTLQQAIYLVTYKQTNGKYYINHVRGDLFFRAKKRKQLFTSTIHTWFETVTCEIETDNVSRFSSNDRLPTNNIFSSTKFDFDPDFWGGFNTIIPEEKLKALILDYFSKEKNSRTNE